MSVNVVIKSVFDNKGLKQAEKAFEGLGSGVAKFGAILGGALSVAAITNFSKDAIFAASALSAEFEGVNQVFDESAKAVQAFAKGASYSVGLSETAALQAAKSFGVFASAAGLSGDEAATFSVELVKAAGDLASFNDVPVEDTLAAIRSGLQGQGEPLSRFGILMNEATLKAKAMELQIISNTKSALTPQQKVLAANALILDDLGVAQGDFVNYQDTFGNALKTVQAEFQNLQAEIGTAMIPAMETLLGEAKLLIPVIGKELKDAVAQVDFKQIASDMGDFIKNIVENLDEIVRFSQVVGGIIISVGSLVAVIKTAIGVQTLFNAVVAANPYILAATALIALAGGMAVVMATAEKTNAEFDTSKYTTEQLVDELDRLKAAYQDGLIPTDKYLKKQAELEGQLRKIKGIANEAAGELNRFNTLSGPVNQKKSWDAWANSWIARGEAAAKIVKEEPFTAPYTPSTPTETTEQRFAKVQAVIKKAQASIARAERDYGKAVYDINRAHNERVLQLNTDAANRQASLVIESQKRITDAFRNATKLSLSNLFTSETTRELTTQVKKLTQNLTVSVTKETEKTAYKSVTDIINGLRDRLTASKNLLANASKLAGLGFKQTFIEQVLETGTDTGNALAGAILEASPETQSELKTLFGELENVSEDGADSLAQTIYDKFDLATNAMKEQSVAIQTELNDALEAENKILLQSLADAAYAFQTQIADIKTQFLLDLDQFDGKFAGLGNTIKGVLANLQALLGAGSADIKAAITAQGSGSVVAGATVTESVAVKDIRNATGIIIDELSDVKGTAAYLQARINAANTYIKLASSNAAQDASAAASIADWTRQLTNLQGAAATGNVAGTVVNINVRTDTTQSQAMVGKTIGNIVTKYVTTGGQVIVSGN
jgi:hypothetical protein